MITPLGQNFLTDESIAKKIVDSANISANDNILEIGPGKGILTEHLIKHSAKVLAAEIDSTLVNLLRKRFHKSCYSNFIEIITGDILKLNLPQLIKDNNFENYKVVANLPYYITSKIIRLLLETKYPPAEMILMVQKEVGERIVALDGKESLLSISVKFYAEPKILFYVPKENFDPVPEVDSAVIHIKRKDNPPEADASEFFSLVRAGFSSKRKMLLNNLSASLNLPKNKVSQILEKAGIEPTARAEKLSLEDWINLYGELDK